ncbi:MAG TPA: hypothetical protein VMW72_22750 [Sedimentisphaerales bacterium]|nr:hypothetical protein [Sedimentisphaerales bacterium]
MSEETKRLEIAIYRKDPEENWYVNEVDVGPLLYGLTEEPFNLANVGEKGTIKLEVQRTHEWEIIIGLVLAGSGIFLAGALTEIGKRFGGWLTDQVIKLSTSTNPEARARGMTTVKIAPGDLEDAGKGITKLLSYASERNVRVQLIVEPKKKRG